MGPQTIRFLIQIAFALAGMLAVISLPEPYGPSLGLFLLVFGLWIARRIFKRMMSSGDVKQDLPQREGEGE